ncbi:adenylate cyclase [Calothrix sp. NIES-4071]|nr:adenylate cyclase [Calothrix sp. NIES-4071]BAZ56405.1 adenylate cyclase [Calothrix sp. NIES-4105]
MGKLVILKLGEGNFEQGFHVTLQIGDENVRPVVEITGELPPEPDIKRYYHQWQSIYRSLNLPGRPIGIPKQTIQTPTIEDCQKAAQELNARFNSWLASESFRRIREKWLEKLLPEDNIRVLLQTQDLWLKKLPWHLWDLLERYPKAEVALSTPGYEQVSRSLPESYSVKVLAILGNSEGIDTKTDRKILEELPLTDTTFLVEPECKDLTNQLWEQNWQILFFAGHSSSQESGDTGKIFINQTESLTISQLKYALKKAVERGLQLAIFNSCDGLGLAREFADLQIPQIIVMREPVPDKVAQEFLKYFLEAMIRGELLYLAVREARERLQGLENKFPCASWLPIICQNPADIPFTWHSLIKTSDIPILEKPVKRVKNLVGLSLMLFISLATTGLVIGVRYLGVLQPLELGAFDLLLRSRPTEKPDSRILVITATEEDVQSQRQEEQRGSWSDKALSEVLEKVLLLQPQAIGIDVYRDYSVSKNYPQLAKRLRESEKIIAVCQVNDSQKAKTGVAPPKEVPLDRLGFSNTLNDTDNIVRRHYLALTPPPSSPCLSSYSLSVQLALRYLYSKGVKLEFTTDGAWQLGKLKINPLEAHAGGYQGINALGHQILLNYRASPTLEDIAPRITLNSVLAGKLNAAAVKDRIVIIGTTAETFPDYWLTPYKDSETHSQEIPGVILQAQMVSQLISAALDGRPLLSTWSIGSETIWIWFWSTIGCVLVYFQRKPTYFLLGVGSCIIFLYASCFVLLVLFSYWVPLVPTVLGLASSAIGVLIFSKSLLNQQNS